MTDFFPFSHLRYFPQAAFKLSVFFADEVFVRLQNGVFMFVMVIDWGICAID